MLSWTEYSFFVLPVSSPYRSPIKQFRGKGFILFSAVAFPIRWVRGDEWIFLRPHVGTTLAFKNYRPLPFRSHEPPPHTRRGAGSASSQSDTSPLSGRSGSETMRMVFAVPCNA